ncbi:MAG: class I SAM-dependent methyltransferase [Proteobacteria bacterium]|nr:class I SAM-dependent methyltransferase [Pseudomonadota bacterium]
MSDYYQKNFQAYHAKTFAIDPTSFLEPLAARLSPEAFILDAGCASGRDLMWLKQRGFEVIGMERSPGLAQLALENAGCEIIEDDFETYDFSYLEVDAIVLAGALVHIPPDRFAAAFKNITSALTRHGNVLVSLKEGDGIRTDDDGRTFYLWQDAAARKLFGELGFMVRSFSKSVSKTGSGDVWLVYVLQK